MVFLVQEFSNFLKRFFVLPEVAYELGGRRKQRNNRTTTFHPRAYELRW